MNKIFKYIIPGLLLFVSCDSFLEEQSADLIRPESITHYQELLVGEGSYRNFMDNAWFVELMTDNVELFENTAEGLNTTSSTVEEADGAYLWQREIENDLFKDKLYKNLYSNILAANTCLLDINSLPGTEDERKILLGQASFVRAYGYFVLANLYGQAYNEANVESDLCVPIVNVNKPTLEKFKRNTIKEVWNLIKTDISNAVSNLKTVNRKLSVYEVNYYAALLLSARISLFMEDYDAVIKTGEKFLELKSALMDITDGETGDKHFIDPIGNPEIVYNFGSKYEYNYLNRSTGYYQFSFVVFNAMEQSLMRKYEEGDGRVKAFFEEPRLGSSFFSKNCWLPMKYESRDGISKRSAFRTAEVYLMMAEAYARKAEPDNSKALLYLNTLREKRVLTTIEHEGEDDEIVFVPLELSDFSTQEELIEFIWDERRRELCFDELHRWWDLRRIGQPSLTHNWKGGTNYVLQEKDPAYILNFPKEERAFNDALESNPRPVRVAVN